MRAVLEALTLAIGQLTDPPVVRVLAKSLGVTLLVFAVLGGGLWWAMDRVAAAWRAPVLPDAYEGAATALLVVVLGVIGFWLLFRVVALAVLQFFADEVVAAVEARHYPAMAAQARPLPFQRDLANSLKGMGRAIGASLLALPVALVLLVTGIGPALVFLAVNAWLLGRELTDMGWLRHCGEPAGPNPVVRGERLLLGAAVAALMAVPVLNLVAPVLGAAAGTHLAQRAIARSGGEQLHA